MKHEYTVDLTTSGINKLIGKLGGYKIWLLKKTDEVAKRLAEIGATDASLRFARAVYTGENDVEISVKHNGPEDITWYGFLTDDVTTQESRLIYDKRNELLRSGGKIDIIRDSERNILLEGLEEDTSYKYIVFGLTADGERPKNVGNGSVKFSTTQNVYVMTETKDWTINYLGRNEAKDKELIEIV